MSDDEKAILAELADHPAWAAFRAVVKERMEMQFRMFAADLMDGKPVSAEDREYARGFFAGMKYLLDKPKVSQAEIARELAKREKAEAHVT